MTKPGNDALSDGTSTTRTEPMNGATPSSIHKVASTARLGLGDHTIEHRQPPRRCGEVGYNNSVRWSGVVVVVACSASPLNKNTSPRAKPDEKPNSSMQSNEQYFWRPLPLAPVESYIVFFADVYVQRVRRRSLLAVLRSMSPRATLVGSARGPLIYISDSASMASRGRWARRLLA